MNQMAWTGNLGIDPKKLQFDHMTQSGHPQPEQHFSHDNSLEHVDPSLRYLSFDQPNPKVMGLAGPNLGVQADNYVVSDFNSPLEPEALHPSNDASNHTNRSAFHELEGTNAYQSTSHGGSQMAESSIWRSQAVDSFDDIDMGLFNEIPNVMAWQPNSQGSLNSMPSAMNGPVAPKINSLKPTSVAKRAQKSTSRNRKNRMRLNSRRSRSPAHSRNVQAKASLASGTTSSQVAAKVDPNEAIALFEASIQPFSSFSQLKAADLISQLKQLVLEEQKYGRGSQSGTSDVLTTNTAPSTLDSVSNPELVDAESFTDNTSVSSTPRQALKDTDNRDDTDGSTSTGDSQNELKHEPCENCGVKALLQCTWKNCGYSTHSFADYKRHESGEKHWPQERFMCLECTDHSFSHRSSGSSCTFCQVPFSTLSANIPGNYVQSRVQCRTARREITTFSRKDHLITHLRKDHNMPNMNQTIDTWKFGIDSNWPRQCGFCGIRFRTWTDRMNHLKREFEKGNDMSKWKLPFPRSLDSRPSGSTLPKDDDDDDQDDHFGGQGGSRTKSTGKPNGQPERQSQSNDYQNNAPQWSSSQQRYQRAHACLSSFASIGSPSSPGETGKRSLALQRYLNDVEEPVAARLGWRGPAFAKSDCGIGAKTIRQLKAVQPVSHSGKSKDKCPQECHFLNISLPRVPPPDTKIERDVCETVVEPGEVLPPQELDGHPCCYELPATEVFVTELQATKGSNQEVPSATTIDSFTSLLNEAHQDLAHHANKETFLGNFGYAECAPTFSNASEWKDHITSHYSSPMILRTMSSGVGGADLINLGHNIEFLRFSKCASSSTPSSTTRYSPGPFSTVGSPPPSFDSPLTECTTPKQSQLNWLSPLTSSFQSCSMEALDRYQNNFASSNNSPNSFCIVPPSQPLNDEFRLSDPYNLEDHVPSTFGFLVDPVACAQKCPISSQVRNPNGLTPSPRLHSGPSKGRNFASRQKREPRLGKDVVEYLDREFMNNHKPTTVTKRQISEATGMSLNHVNNWFQNRRARIKQQESKGVCQLGLLSDSSVVEQPEKCPLETGDYHLRGFVRKYDKNRHILTHYKETMVCGFCPSSWPEISFCRVNDFIRRLAAVYDVDSTSKGSQNLRLGNDVDHTETTPGEASVAAGKCSACECAFNVDQALFNHSDDCLRREIGMNLGHGGLKHGPQMDKDMPGIDTAKKEETDLRSLWTTFKRCPEIPSLDWRKENRTPSISLPRPTETLDPSPTSTTRAVEWICGQCIESSLELASLFGDKSATLSDPSTGIVQVWTSTPSQHKPRAKRILSPEAKEKAAIIRRLGACSRCRSRKTCCRFEHHDPVDSANYDQPSSPQAVYLRKNSSEDKPSIYRDYPSCSLPLSRSTSSSGRQNELDRPGKLNSAGGYIDGRHQPRNYCIYGRAGVGKTHLVLEYVRNREKETNNIFRVNTVHNTPYNLKFLSPDDLLRCLNIEKQRRLERAPPIRLHAASDFYGNFQSGLEDRLDANGLRTMTDAAFHRYLENLKASSGCTILDALWPVERTYKRIHLAGGFVACRKTANYTRKLMNCEASYLPGRAKDTIDNVKSKIQDILRNRGADNPHFTKEGLHMPLDWLTGTSTGGLLALAVAREMRLDLSYNIHSSKAWEQFHYPFKLPRRWEHLNSICRAVDYLHQQQMTRGQASFGYRFDLKPRNIMIGGEFGDEWFLLSDFGTSEQRKSKSLCQKQRHEAVRKWFRQPLSSRELVWTTALSSIRL